MNVLVDMNLPPAWVGFLEEHAIHAVHWSAVGSPSAQDSTIMAWALDHGHCVLTHDLDFAMLLGTTGDRGPSVILVRALDVFPQALGALVVQVLVEHAAAIDGGAIVTLDGQNARLRILPIRR